MPKPEQVKGQPAAPTPKESRLQMLGGDKTSLPMPPNPMPKIIDWLMEIGMVSSDGMGAKPISWGEINEWQRGSGVQPDPWIIRLIHALSVEYVSWLRKSEDERCPSPWGGSKVTWESLTESQRLEALG